MTRLATITRTTAATYRQELTDFYARPGNLRLLLASGLLLFYVGSMPAYYVHAIVRGEAGPRIHDVTHWALDSTLGFVGLTPAVAVILPLAAVLLRRRRALRAAPFVLITGALVALVTAPGPFLHQLIAGRGTAVANAAERVFASHHLPPVTGPVAGPNLVAEGAIQLVLGLVVYTLLMALSVSTVGRHLFARQQPAMSSSTIPAQRQAGRRVHV